MKIARDPKYLHPLLRTATQLLLDGLARVLPVGMTATVISMHRTPAEQFELFKQGRAFEGGKWVVVDRSKVVTGKDGFVSASRHNNLPCTAMDLGLFTKNNEGKQIYLPESPHYKKIGPVAARLGLDWGGNWTTLVDQPHVEIPLAAFFQRSLQKDIALLWQRYLTAAGTYQGALDGIFGEKSQDALEATAGSRERTLQAWDVLFDRFGPAELLVIDL